MNFSFFYWQGPLTVADQQYFIFIMSIRFVLLIPHFSNVKRKLLNDEGLLLCQQSRQKNGGSLAPNYRRLFIGTTNNSFFSFPTSEFYYVKDVDPDVWRPQHIGVYKNIRDKFQRNGSIQLISANSNHSIFVDVIRNHKGRRGRAQKTFK